ncbi:MAG: ATP-binding protein, partial [Arcobacteraceae bacterium]
VQMRMSIKTKLNLFGILIILLTLSSVTISIAWVLTENNIAQSKKELKENMKMIQTEVEYNKKRLLSSSQKTAELQELDLKIKHITRNKERYNQNIQPLYIQLANATHDSAQIAGNIWKTMIYDKEGDLISLSHIEANYSKKGYVFDFPDAEIMIANGKTVADPLSNPWKKYSKYHGFESHFKEMIPEKETIIYAQTDGKLTLKSFYPIMGLNFNKEQRKMTPSSVGFVLVENPLDLAFVDKIRKLISKKEINIYLFEDNTMKLTVGTLKHYKILNKRYLTDQKVQIDGTDYLQETLPLYNDDKLIGAISLFEIEKTIGDYVMQLLKSLIIVFIVILCIVIPFTVILIRTISNPLINLQRGIKELSSGNLGKQLEIYSFDEIGQLTMSFNDMSKELAKTDKIKVLNRQLKKTSEELSVAKEELEALNNSLEEKITAEIEKNTKQQLILMQQNKLVQMGEMIENIAHQWRQPLAQINSSVLLVDTALAQDNITNVMVEEKLLEIESLTAYMSKTIDDFKNFFDANKQKTYFGIEEAISKSYTIVKGRIISNHISIVKDIDENLHCFSYLEELQQLILTLLNNAIDALQTSKIKEPEIKIKAYLQEKNIIIKIEDNGLGIDSEIITKIFEPYFTTKHKSQGTGLGLYMAKMIVESALNGTLTVYNNEHGVTFTISVPQGEV